MRPGLIIFDCDGTLVDSELIANQVLVDVVAEHGLQLTLTEALIAFKGGKMAESVTEIERRLGRALPEHFVPEIRRRTAQAFESSLLPVPGAIELVETLTTAKCVASAGPREKIELTLSVTGLLPHFREHIFSSYEVGSWKPHPGLFLHAAEVMGFLPGDCVVVEDSLPGIRAGVAAGMRVFALQPHGDETEMPEEVVVIRELGELRSHLSLTAASPG